MFTVEGENDDISGVGQTKAAHDIMTGIPAARRAHYMQPKVGHYGVFNGSRFRAEIARGIADFIATFALRPASEHHRANGAAKTNGNGHHDHAATPATPVIAAAKRAKAPPHAKPAAKKSAPAKHS